MNEIKKLIESNLTVYSDEALTEHFWSSVSGELNEGFFDTIAAAADRGYNKVRSKLPFGKNAKSRYELKFVANQLFRDWKDYAIKSGSEPTIDNLTRFIKLRTGITIQGLNSGNPKITNTGNNNTPSSAQPAIKKKEKQEAEQTPEPEDQWKYKNPTLYKVFSDVVNGKLKITMLNRNSGVVPEDYSWEEYYRHKTKNKLSEKEQFEYFVQLLKNMKRKYKTDQIVNQKKGEVFLPESFQLDEDIKPGTTVSYKGRPAEVLGTKDGMTNMKFKDGNNETFFVSAKNAEHLLHPDQKNQDSEEGDTISNDFDLRKFFTKVAQLAFKQGLLNVSYDKDKNTNVSTQQGTVGRPRNQNQNQEDMSQSQTQTPSGSTLNINDMNNLLRGKVGAKDIERLHQNAERSRDIQGFVNNLKTPEEKEEALLVGAAALKSLKLGKH